MEMTTRKGLALAWLYVALGGCQSAVPTPAFEGPVTTANQSDLSPGDSARVCLRTAIDFERQGYDREAILQYERARVFDPALASSVATRRLAVLYGRTGEAARAATEYDAALRATPDDPLLLNDEGYFRLTQGDAIGAERSLRQAASLDPRCARAWVNLGLALAAMHRYDDSYAAFARALPPAQARANVGVALARQGRYSEAETSLRQALAKDATLPQAQVTLQWVEGQLHPTTRAAVPDGP